MSRDPLVGPIDEIIAARVQGVVHCGLSTQEHPSVRALAGEFGLSENPTFYLEIDAVTARCPVHVILHQDLAYEVEIMPTARAEALADQFLAQFGDEGARYYTNGRLDKARGPGVVSWNPVTSATFDTGVLVISRQCSGCLWMEDED